MPSALILRPNTCSTWIKCPSSPQANDFEEGVCVLGLYFNKNTGKCEYKENVNCPYESKPKNRCTNASEGTFLADENDCNGYIYCRKGEEVKSQCPSILVFDPNINACVYKHQYKCPEIKPAGEANPLCLSLPDRLFFAHQSDCTKYHECRNGILLTHTCKSSFAWDYLEGDCVAINDDMVCLPSAKKPEPEIKTCINRTGPVSDGVSCSGYYNCKKMANHTHDRKPQHLSCSSGKFFDPRTLSCRDRLNVNCPFNRCEGLDNIYVNVAGDCKAYALCKKGLASFFDVCPNEHFFDERQQGCIPQVVNYPACSV